MSELPQTPEEVTAEPESLSVEHWKSEVLQICKPGGVSMAEISRLPGASGDHVLCIPDRGNVILWTHLCQNLTTAISELQAGGEIKPIAVTLSSTLSMGFICDSLSRDQGSEGTRRPVGCQ